MQDSLASSYCPTCWCAWHCVVTAAVCPALLCFWLQNDPAMQAYMYPMLKDDFQMVETYTVS